MAAALDGHAAYAVLRRTILEAGLLGRAYSYYLWRTALSFAILGAGIGLASDPLSGPSVLAHSDRPERRRLH